MGEKANVFIVAGNRLLREALARVLRKRGDFSVLAAVPYSAELLEEIHKAEAEVLIVDSVTISLAGSDFVRQVADGKPSLQVLLIGMPKDERLFLTVVRAGARGYVLDEASATELLGVVRAVSSGDAVCPASLCGALFNQVARPRPEMPNVQVRLRLGLTRREQQLVPLIAQGLTNKEIASHFSLSEQTVKNHIHRMLQKVGVSDRLAVVDYCQNKGFQIF